MIEVELRPRSSPSERLTLATPLAPACSQSKTKGIHAGKCMPETRNFRGAKPFLQLKHSRVFVGINEDVEGAHLVCRHRNEKWHAVSTIEAYLMLYLK